MSPSLRKLSITLAVCTVAAGIHAQSSAPADKYLWLEDVSSERSLAWVKAHNARAAQVLEGDPLYQKFLNAAAKIADDPDHLAPLQLRGNLLNTQWSDRHNPRGLVRQTTVEDYLDAHPHWHAILDFDRLGRQENVGWTPTYSLDRDSMACLYPGNTFCLVGLSNGGEDAITLREFNFKTASFVPSGFHSDHSKQQADWEDENTLLIARDWGPGSLTTSGYPFVVKRWKRGTPLGEAKEVFRGQPSDVETEATALQDGDGNRLVIFQRYVTALTSQFFLKKDGRIQQVGLPENCSVYGLQHGHLIVLIRQNWQGLQQGSVVDVSLHDLQNDPLHLRPTVIFRPTSDEFANGVGLTRNYLALVTLKNVRGRAYVYVLGRNGWSRRELPVPENSSVDLSTSTPLNDTFFLFISSYLIPSSYAYCDAEKGTCRIAHSQPTQFDASHDVVEQLFATSADGTRIPYFIVHRRDMKLDGSTPTLMEAYGGWEVSQTPYYDGVLGKLWIERGGAYVVPNIRGGGEFGPGWHEAARKLHRQRTYDDFTAVTEDLFKRKITSPQRLGIKGASSGGLLMGVAMTQHPAYYKAVISEVPLLDMLRYEKIAAGASWVDEYGSESVPEERAYLAATSPYAQLKPNVTYPEPFIFTTTKDDRVGPQHARKFAAKLEEYHDPFFYDEIVEGGHNSGADLEEQARTSAFQFVYLTRKLMD